MTQFLSAVRQVDRQAGGQTNRWTDREGQAAVMMYWILTTAIIILSAAVIILSTEVIILCTPLIILSTAVIMR